MAMGFVRSIGVLFMIVGLILVLFVTLDPRIKPPIFEGKNIKYVAYREVVVTTGGVTKNYEQVVLLVTGRVELPDTRVTINSTAYPITSGLIYYFSAYYFYIPTFYTTAKYMSVGPVTYTNVYSKYAPKYERAQRIFMRAGAIAFFVGLAMVVAPSIRLPERVKKEEKSQEEENEETIISEEFEMPDDLDEEEEDVDEDVDMYLPPVD